MFQTSTCVTLHVWVAARRLARARELLLEGNESMEQIASACSFTHASYLTCRFREAYGLSLGRFRKLYPPHRIIL